MALTLDPDDTGRRIDQLAWGGFVCLEDIAGIIEDEYLDSSTPTEADRTWIRTNADQVAASKRAAETSWPGPTFDAGGIGAGLSAFCFYHAQDVR